MQHSTTTTTKTTTTFVFRVKDILSNDYLLRSTKNLIILDPYHQKNLQIYILMVGMFYIEETQIYPKGFYLRKQNSRWETFQLHQTPLSTTTISANNLNGVTGDDKARVDKFSWTIIGSCSIYRLRLIERKRGKWYILGLQ